MAAFRKMHGLGNDFAVFDRRGQPGLTPDHARRVADRHRGIGCDQVIVLEDTGLGADVFMRILNPDGSEAGACGNATRCVASLLGPDRVVVRTISGDLPATRGADGAWTVDMGAPRLDWRDIPLAEPADTLRVPIEVETLARPAACSMGNPHATFFVPQLEGVPIAALGPRIENHPMFPQRTNAGFAEVLAPDRIRLRMWERGAGITLACGSGACAALVNAHRRGLAGRAATLVMDGGELRIEWRGSDDHVLMTGPVATAFTGEFPLDA
jgi:diaminopimelate epimerase